MASIYRPTRRKNGKLLRSRKWYVRYRDHEGRLRTVPGFTDKTATQQLAAKLERDAAMIRSGLLDPAAMFQDATLESHLKAFENSLRAKQVTEQQIRQVCSRCRKLLERCKVQRLSDLHAERVSEQLTELRNPIENGKGLSVQTSNHYLRAVKQFTRWLLQERRLSHDPLTRVEMLNVQVDRRHDRRALSDEEVSRLLRATESGTTFLGMHPAERRMLYLMALSTGLRASELASLTVRSLDLSPHRPTVTVRAAYSKRRREDVLPLPADLVPEVVTWVNGRLSDDALWPGDWAKHKHAGRLLRHDLENAGIAWQDAQGRFADFHALRHTFITNLGRHGVSLTTAQKLARHSTPVLTAARYTHIDLAEQKKAVDLLPLQRQLQRVTDFSGQQAASAGTSQDSKSTPPESEEPLENRGSRGKSQRRGRDSPTLINLWSTCEAFDRVLMQKPLEKQLHSVSETSECRSSLLILQS